MTPNNGRKPMASLSNSLWILLHRFFHMTILLRSLLLTFLLFIGSTAVATPQADANLIALRNLNPALVEDLQQRLKKWFVDVYFKPISGQGIEIADLDGFIDLIPDEDIAPYVDRLVENHAETLLSALPHDQLATIAAIMRTDQDATMQDIRSEQYLNEYIAALEQARSNTEPLKLNSLAEKEVEALILQMDVVATLLGGKTGDALVQDLSIGLGYVSMLLEVGHEIEQIEHVADNPVTIAAVKADGVLKFPNPVQRQILLRRLSGSNNADGIKFLKPPSRTAPSH